MSVEFRALQPAEYYRQHIDQGVRPDGRKLHERRPIAVSSGTISTADGSSVVRQGNTTVVCGIKLELGPPRPEEPDLGYIVPNVELPPMCNPHFKPGPPSEAAQTVSQFLLDVLTSSGCVKATDLCVATGKLVWVLYIDIVCLDHDGNVADAAVSALTAALRTVQLPRVVVDGETGVVEVVEGERQQLSVRTVPVSSTVAVFGGERLLCDPTWEEEQLAQATVTTVMLASGEMCHVCQPGGATIEPETLQKCLDLSQRHSENIDTVIKHLDKK